MTQDPIRIAPGTSGTLLLYVEPSPEARIPSGGKVGVRSDVFVFGMPRWDRPQRGSLYTSGFFIRVPVAVPPRTPYGTYDVTGEVRIAGVYYKPLPRDTILEHAKGTGPAVGTFRGSIRVGPAMPLATGLRAAETSPGRPGRAPGEGAEPKTGAPSELEPDSNGQDLPPVRPVAREPLPEIDPDPTHDVVAPASPAPESRDPSDLAWFLASGILIAAIVLVWRGRR